MSYNKRLLKVLFDEDMNRVWNGVLDLCGLMLCTRILKERNAESLNIRRYFVISCLHVTEWSKIISQNKNMGGAESDLPSETLLLFILYIFFHSQTKIFQVYLENTYWYCVYVCLSSKLFQQS